MTLLISCLTAKYIVTVSDRRLTSPKGKVVDDAANKVVFFAPDALFSYTGIAEINGLRTDEWIADQLYGQAGIQNAITNLTTALDATIKALGAPNRHLTVVVDCWATKIGETIGKPYSCAITNCWDSTARKTASKPYGKFCTWTQTLPEGVGHTLLAQPEFAAPEVRNLRRDFVRVMRHASAKPITISSQVAGRFMAKAVRQVASRDPRVGKSLMVSVLYNHELAENANNQNSFSYLDDGSDKDITYIPTIVTPLMAMKSAKMYKGPPRFAIRHPAA